MIAGRSLAGSLVAVAVAWASAIGCGGTAKSNASGDGGSGAMPTGGPVEVTTTLDTTTHYQTMVGFGAAIAFYANVLADRQVQDDDIYQVLFSDLGLDILRIGNWYQNQVEKGATATTAFSDQAAVTIVQSATQALGHAPKILMSSWSPPSYLKSTGDTKNGGTLIKDGTSYAYAQFAQWWVTSLGAYATKSIVPDYISIQNEPDFTATWESCRFDPTEGTYAAYGSALDAVYTALASANLGSTPQIVGPESSGISRNKVQGYLAQMPLGDITAIAHHLYNGGDSAADPAPDSFATTMGGVTTAATADAKPIFMTEFSPNSPSMFNTAWMIHDAVAVEGVSAYVYWELAWPTGGATPTALVTLEDPSKAFTTPKGYTINDLYYAVKHYSKWVDAGWVRVGAASTFPAVKVTAYESPDGANVTVVLLNTDAMDHVVTVDPGTFSFGTATAYRTSGTAERTAPVSITTPAVITMPSQSIATVVLTP